MAVGLDVGAVCSVFVGLGVAVGLVVAVDVGVVVLEAVCVGAGVIADWHPIRRTQNIKIKHR